MIKDFKKDYYTGLKGVYFYRILETIISVGKLRERRGKILDFGSGTGKLKSLLGEKVVNYDPIRSLSDVSDWKKVRFDFFVANEVFYLFSETELGKLLKTLKQVNNRAIIIVGVARENFLSKILARLAGEPDAHVDGKISPSRQKEILEKDLVLVDWRSVFWLCDVYRFRFRTA